jgi:lysophospholipase L1-like esterase
MECREYSWSTGTLVNSHYQRLVALNPALAGHATNAAESGATILRFVTQVNTFAASRPDYVTVLTSSNDICRGDPPPGNPSQHNPPTAVADFAARFRAGMDALFAASPNSRVLVASLENLESIRNAVLARNPSATWQPALCRDAFFNRSDAERAMLMNRLAEYNTVLQTQCATYTNCLFDGFALTNHVWSPSEVGPDNLHPSVAGEEMMAQVLFDVGYTWATTKGPQPSPPGQEAGPTAPAPMGAAPRVTG